MGQGNDRDNTVPQGSNSINSGFLTSGIVAFQVGGFSVVLACSVLCRMLRIISGIYLLDASAPLPIVAIENVCRCCQMSLVGKITPG